jgi:hypothetical protein
MRSKWRTLIPRALAASRLVRNSRGCGRSVMVSKRVVGGSRSFVGGYEAFPPDILGICSASSIGQVTGRRWPALLDRRLMALRGLQVCGLRKVSPRLRTGLPKRSGRSNHLQKGAFQPPGCLLP